MWPGGLGVVTANQQHMCLLHFCFQIKTTAWLFFCVFFPRPLYAPTTRGRRQERAQGGVLLPFVSHDDSLWREMLITKTGRQLLMIPDLMCAERLLSHLLKDRRQLLTALFQVRYGIFLFSTLDPAAYRIRLREERREKARFICTSSDLR